MGVESDFRMLKLETQRQIAELEEKLAETERRSELREFRLLRRIEALERLWTKKPPGELDEKTLGQLKRSRFRRAKIPPRPAIMKAAGVGVDPPQGDSEWSRFQ